MLNGLHQPTVGQPSGTPTANETEPRDTNPERDRTSRPYNLLRPLARGPHGPHAPPQVRDPQEVGPYTHQEEGPLVLDQEYGSCGDPEERSHVRDVVGTAGGHGSC